MPASPRISSPKSGPSTPRSTPSTTPASKTRIALLEEVAGRAPPRGARRRGWTCAPPAAALAVVAALVLAPSAAAQDEGTAGFKPPLVTVPSALPATPPDFSIDAGTAINTANEDPRIEELRREHGGVSAAPQLAAGHWEITYIDDEEPIALVFVDGNSQTVQEVWTGAQVIWPMARGYEAQFGHILNAPYVWIPMALVFFFGLFDLRRPRRLAHLDLLVLLSFGISHIFFNTGDIGLSVPLAYPPLIYLMARMLWIGFSREGIGLRPSVPITWLAVAAVFLCGFKVALNIADSGVIDVGYSGVIGADRITHGDAIYGDDAFPSENRTGDTYGPVNYAAYIPFELAWPWSGEWDKLPAAHAAAIVFDLAAVVGLFVLGRRLRPGRGGRDLGVIMAFAWAAYPYTDFALQSNSNDSLIGALLIWSLVAFTSLGWRAILLALAVGAKFTPLFLVPLFATGYEGLAGRFESAKKGGASRIRVLSGLPRRPRLALLYFSTVFVAVSALLLVYPAIDPGLATAWDRTIKSQLDRESPFSVWGQVSALQPVQTLVMVGVAGLAASLALVPRRRSLAQVAALSAAVMIGAQLTLEHWFYAYLPWFFGMLIAATAPARAAEGDSRGIGRRDEGGASQPRSMGYGHV
jgi:hypothetical protein